MIFILMVLGIMAYRMFKQRKCLQQVGELRLEPQELKAMMDPPKRKGTGSKKPARAP